MLAFDTPPPDDMSDDVIVLDDEPMEVDPPRVPISHNWTNSNNRTSAERYLCDSPESGNISNHALDVQPQLSPFERMKIQEFTSIHFCEFYRNDLKDIPHKEILFKANRIFENFLNKMRDLQKIHNTEPVKRRIYHCFLKLGHINLLGQDWTKALSAYQQAYKMNSGEFWKNPNNYFGLGLVYFHFKHFKLALDCFSKVLYTNPFGLHALESRIRLAACYHSLEDVDRALKLYKCALSDSIESCLLSKKAIRFNIAYVTENYIDVNEADGLYKKLVEEIEEVVKLDPDAAFPGTAQLVKLQAACYKQLGWLDYRRSQGDETERAKLLESCEKNLKKSQTIDPSDGKTYYYLGRRHLENEVVGETEEEMKQLRTKQAKEAFHLYRQSVDKMEANADTWCSIGTLYQKQAQPIDALQAFICAVELDPTHSAAWTDLGEVYEKNAQFQDALECFRRALEHNPRAPEPIKARVLVLEKVLGEKPGGSTPAANINKPLPTLKEAYQTQIPSELRQRQNDFRRHTEQLYRDGSGVFRMGDLGAPAQNGEPLPLDPLNEIQMQVLKLLYANSDNIDEHEREILETLQTKNMMYDRDISDGLLIPQMASDLPTLTEDDIVLLQEGKHLVQNLEDPDSDESKQRKPLPDLPQTFSLLSKINVPYDITSQEVLNLSAKRITKEDDFKPVFEEEVAPPAPPPAPKCENIKIESAPCNGTRTQLHRPTPLLQVETRKDANSTDLQRYLENTPIALVRGLTSVLRMDLSLFSTKTLLEKAGDDEMEVRTQYRMASDTNVDHLGNPSWNCYSSQKYTTITKYAQYQAETFKHSLKEEAEKLRQSSAKYSHSMDSHGGKRRKLANGEDAMMPMKTIKFGTNVDLSDDTKWKVQLQEMSKMPPFCRLIAGNNMLSHLGHQILGMNTVQLYMKVPGARTPAHQENNSFASININIGPGDCEWFGVPYEYWGVVERLCRKHKIDYLKGSYWPNIEELLKEQVPIYRFTQKAGDLVWVGGGCVHWVQATGWCNNIAWNVAPLNYNQLAMAINSYEYNKIQNYRSLVPVQNLAWQLAKNVRFTNQPLYHLVRGIMIRSLSFCKIVLDYAQHHKKSIKTHARAKGEFTHYCTTCEIEVFNILFVREGENLTFLVYCVYCAQSQGLDKFIVLQQIPMTELTSIYDNMVLNPNPKLQLSA